MSEKVSFGLKNVHYANFEIIDGEPVFEKPVPYPGAVEITNDPKGEQTEFFADNTTYYVTISNQGYEGSYTSAELPEDFRVNVLGETRINGLLVEKTTAKVKPVALLFEFDTDKRARRHALLNVTFNRPSFGSKTKETSAEVNTNELTYAASPINEITKVTTSDVTPADVYDNWYEKVQYEYMTTPIDQTPLTVTVVPADEATDVSTTTHIVWTFNKAIRDTDMTSANFVVMDSTSEITGTLSLSTDKTTVTFAPTAPLATSTSYVAIATKNIKNASGNSLAANNMTNFTTEV